MEELERLKRLIGEGNIEKLRQQTVVVLGLGGVGGYVVEALVRSGIGTIILVDYDVVDITNMNRQVIATYENIGIKKTKAWAERINNINKNCTVKIIEEKINSQNIGILFEFNPTYVVDACDFMEAKKSIILECAKRDIPLISSMGTGNKMDPSKLQVMDIRKTSYDPLAKELRKFIKDNRINKKIPVVCSVEQPKKIISPIGSNAFVPAAAGLLCASHVINDIVGDINDFS